MNTENFDKETCRSKTIKISCQWTPNRWTLSPILLLDTLVCLHFNLEPKRYMIELLEQFNKFRVYILWLLLWSRISTKFLSMITVSSLSWTNFLRSSWFVSYIQVFTSVQCLKCYVPLDVSYPPCRRQGQSVYFPPPLSRRDRKFLDLYIWWWLKSFLDVRPTFLGSRKNSTRKTIRVFHKISEDREGLTIPWDYSHIDRRSTFKENCRTVKGLLNDTRT